MKKRDHQNLRPLKRGRLRLLAGKAYYSLSRHLLWHSGKHRFSKSRRREPHPFVHFSHSTPLFRELQGVDLQYQNNKIVNLKLAVGKLDGIVIKPGETFSYWKLIGKPTAKKAYVAGMVLQDSALRERSHLRISV